MKKDSNSVGMGELATVMTIENWQNAPETIMSFMLTKIKQSGKSPEYFAILAENRFLYDEMIIISAEIAEIAEMRREVKAMAAFKSWRTGAKRQLRGLEDETLDMRRVCQYFLYSYIQAGGRKEEFLPKFMEYGFGKL